jgi:hypothetical protein
MKRIEVRLSLPVVAPLLDVIKGLVDDLKSAPAAPVSPPDADDDFSSEWTRDLVAAQSSDVQMLLSLFGTEFFTEGVVYFDQSNAEAIARSCSAVRLRVRERYLKGLSDESLEAGEVNLAALDEGVRKAFTCYLFLATIQELIVQHLEESIIGS